MKLAYITNASLVGGWAHSIQIVNMCKAFASNGADVTLVLPYRSIFANTDLFDYYSIPKIFKVKMLPCIDIFPGSSHSIFYWLRFISFYVSARVYTLFNHFDIYYSRDLYSPLFLPSIVLEQHSFPKKIHFPLNLIFTKNRKVVALTSFIKQRFVAAGLRDENIIVAHSSVAMYENVMSESKLVIEGISENDFVFGYIGTLKTMGMEKGVALGLKALALLRDNYKFLIVGGEVEDVDYYKKIALELGVIHRAVFVGQVLPSDVLKYTEVCDVFVAPFPENEHYSFYMSPLKIFEYMVSKKPIITTKLPALQEVLTNDYNAMLIEPNNPKGLADAIVKIKENPEYGKKLADQAYSDVVNKYTWDKRAENILKFIQK